MNLKQNACAFQNSAMCLFFRKMKQQESSKTHLTAKEEQNLQNL